MEIIKTVESLKKFKEIFNALRFSKDAGKALSLLERHHLDIDVNWRIGHRENLLLLALNRCASSPLLPLLVRRLLDQGIEVNISVNVQYRWGTPILSALSNAEMARRDNNKKETALSAKDLEIIDWLLAQGADVNFLEPTELHASTDCLMLAASLPTPIFQAILDKTTLPLDLQQSETYYDGPWGGWTAAHWAASAGQMDNLQILFDLGSNFLIEEYRDTHSPLVELHTLSPQLYTDFLTANPSLIEPEQARIEAHIEAYLKRHPGYSMENVGSDTRNSFTTLLALREKILLENNLNQTISSPIELQVLLKPQSKNRI